MNNEMLCCVPIKILERLIPEGVTLYSLEAYTELMKHIVYVPRHQAENNSWYKQLVAYLAITNRNELMLRKRKGESETRLNDKVGCLGGHINENDVTITPSYLGANIACTAGYREYHEECWLYNGYTLQQVEPENFTPILFINKNEVAVDRYHLGIVLQITLEYRLAGENIIWHNPLKRTQYLFESWTDDVIKHYKQERLQ